MKCHQRKVRDHMQATDTGDLFGRWYDTLRLEPSHASVREIDHETAALVILRYEWLGTMPASLTVAHGLYIDRALAAVECYTDTKPAGNYSLDGRPAICLARGACVHWAPNWASSYVLSRSVGLLDGTRWDYVIAYSDTDAGEIGTVYQAASWYCVGTVSNDYWLSPMGERRDRCHHRHHARVRHEDGSFRPVGDGHKVVRAQMVAAGWRYVTGGVRYRYAQAIGRGKVYRERRRRLEAMAIPYPKRAVEVSRETRAQNQGEAAGSIPAHGSEENAA